MADKTLANLYEDNPVTSPTADNLFEIEGMASGAIKFSDLASAIYDPNDVNITNGSATLSNLYTGNAQVTGGDINGTPIGDSTPSTGAFTDVTASGNVDAVYFSIPFRAIWIDNFIRVGSDFELRWATTTDGKGNATVGTALLSRGANNPAFANGTADTTFSIGAASGTGGGVVSQHQIITPPTPTSEDVQTCFDGTNYIIDKPVSAVGSGLTGVPGTLTVGSGWTANVDDGNKTCALPSSGDAATLSGIINGVTGESTVGTAFANLIEQVKALRAAVRDMIVPNT